MASIGHIAVGMAAARLVAPKNSTTKQLILLMLAFSALSMSLDADVLGFRFGIKYADPFGHRGATHSFVFALLVTICCALLSLPFKFPKIRTLAIVFCVVASHALLDTLTDGGLGCALAWPFDDTRYFASWRPLPVAPIGARVLTAHGFQIMATEFLGFLPVFLFACWPRRNSATNGQSRE
jgi:inner membrane protein